VYVRDRLEAPETRDTPPGHLARKPPHRAHYAPSRFLAATIKLTHYRRKANGPWRVGQPNIGDAHNSV